MNEENHVDEFYVGNTIEEINSAIIVQARNHAKICKAHEIARDELRVAKQGLEKVQAALSENIISQLEAQKQKWTVDRVKNLVLLEPLYHKALGGANEAEKKVGMLGGVREASNHQKDMLVTLSANYRHDDREGVYAAPGVNLKNKISEYQERYGQQNK
jgi:hypothetical protein